MNICIVLKVKQHTAHINSNDFLYTIYISIFGLSYCYTVIERINEMKNRNYVINFEEMDGGKEIQIKR